MASIMAKTIIFSVLLVFITSTLSNASSYRTYNGDQDTPIDDEPTYTYKPTPAQSYYRPVQSYKPNPSQRYNYRPVQQYNPTPTQPSYTYQDQPYYYTQPPPTPTYQYNPPAVDYTPPPSSPTYDYNPPAVSSQPPPSPIYSGGGASGSDKDSFLHVHNVARAALGIAPLVWDDVVASFAQNWANQRINDCRLVHSDGPYGENIFWGSGGYSAAFAVQSWVNERKYYDYSSNSCRGGMDCGHYTQIIWKKSTRLGCARVTCNNGGVFVTCNYNPPGNYIGVRPY